MYQPYPTGTQMPEVQRLPVPPSVTNAVKVVMIKIWAFVVWLVGLAAVVLLWRRRSTSFFRGMTPA